MLKRWKCYALLQNKNPYIINTDSVLKFLHGMYNDGWLYSGFCAARSALASVVTIKGFVKLSDHPRGYSIDIHRCLGTSIYGTSI